MKDIVKAITAEQEKQLVQTALLAREFSYSPYSHFAVGAALLAENGTIYQGCNIENAAYSVTNCAERSALFTAISAGQTKFIALAVAGGLAKENDNLPICPPCGVCRQAFAEFAEESLPVYLVTSKQHYKTVTLKELLPGAFTAKELNQ